jgi:hypothetical protein
MTFTDLEFDFHIEEKYTIHSKRNLKGNLGSVIVNGNATPQ